MKIIQKVLIIFIIAIGVIAIVPQTPCYADVQTTVENFEATPVNDNDASPFRVIANVVLGIIQVLSGVMAIIMIAWTGFRLIIETADGKANLKEKMIPIIIGALLVFGATSIARFIIGVVESSS